MSEEKTMYVCHGMYGCDTGCCGYRLCLDDEGDDKVPGSRFEFDHPDVTGVEHLIPSKGAIVRDIETAMARVHR